MLTSNRLQLSMVPGGTHSSGLLLCWVPSVPPMGGTPPALCADGPMKAGAFIFVEGGMSVFPVHPGYGAHWCLPLP